MDPSVKENDYIDRLIAKWRAREKSEVSECVYLCICMCVCMYQTFSKLYETTDDRPDYDTWQNFQ